MKHCPKCNQNKEITSFYKCASRYDGVRAYCKDCTANINKGNTEYFREYNRKRYASDSDFRLKIIKDRTKYKKDNPKKHIAHVLLYQAIKTGKVKIKPCIICGGKGNGHHPDYSKPLEVIWLCPKHHRHTHTGRIDLLLLDL